MSDKKDKRLLDALDYIDEAYVGELEEYYRKRPASSGGGSAGRSRWIGAIVAIAACALLIALAIPTTTIIINNPELFPLVGASDGSGRSEITVERDGSPGLLYEINEDGVSASFIGYGDCTDETVYIASSYMDLPVVAMYNRDFENTSFAPYNQTGLEHVKRVVIPDSVKYVDGVCFQWCPSIESVYYGAGVEYIGAFSFSTGFGMKFSKVEVSSKNPNYSDKGNCIVDLRTNALVLGTYKTEIPDDGSVKIIGKSAFGPARRRLASIVIPEGVKVIDERAFHNCEKLERVILPESLEIIESNSFYGCDKLKKLEIGTELKVVFLPIFTVSQDTEVYYKGTVEQWKTVIKSCRNFVIYQIVDGEEKKIYSAADDVAINTFIVNCTDGTALSNEGATGSYNWKSFREYKEYAQSQFADNKYWIYGPDGLLTEIKPSKEDGD